MNEARTDSALLTAADEHWAFRILYDRYWELMYKKALVRLGNEDDAQDVVQEVFISVWRNRQTIEIAASLEAYLLTAVKYAVIKRVYRAAKKGIQVPLSIEDLQRSELSTEELLHYKELQSAITNEISIFPERMKEIYQLSRVENLSIREIALKLNISEQTVKNTLTTTLKRLKEKLARYSVWIPFLL